MVKEEDAKEEERKIKAKADRSSVRPVKQPKLADVTQWKCDTGPKGVHNREVPLQ